MDEDVLLGKVRNIQTCLKRIRDKTHGDLQTLDDLDVQEIFVLNLQRAVQSTVDLAAHVVASQGLGLPDTLRENFDLLQRAGIIDQPLALAMRAMCGFRNIAVHDYASMDIAVLKSILGSRLSDLEKFYTSILARAGLTD